MRILLIDDEPEMLADIISTYGGYELDIVSDGYQGVQQLLNGKKRYDLIILDIEMPVMNGWQVLKIIRSNKEFDPIRLIVLTSHAEEDTLVRGLRSGADEYWTKPISPKRLLAHIDALSRRINMQAGQIAPLPDSAHSAVSLLTARESEVLHYVVQGFSNQQIADKLIITETTVKNHLASIFKKLNVSNRNQAAFYAQKLQIFNTQENFRRVN